MSIKLNTFFGLLSAAILLAGATSCVEENIPSAKDETHKATMEVRLRSRGEMETRTELQTAAEKRVTSIDVFVFRDGIMEDHKRATGDGITVCDGLQVTYGQKTIWVFCNYAAERLTSIYTPSDAAAIASSFTENARNAFVMTGTTTYTVSASEVEVTVEVRRDVAKVQLAAAPTFTGICAGGTLDNIYLINIPKTYNESVVLTSSSAASAWNFRNTVATAVDSAVASLTSSNTWSTALYGMPNASPEVAAAADGNPSGEDYVTKMVLKTTIGGNTYWYAIGIPGMQPNKFYSISSVTIGMLGADNPNEYVTSTAIQATITVLDWDAGALTTSYNPQKVSITASPSSITKTYSGGSESVTVSVTSQNLFGESTPVTAGTVSVDYSVDGGDTWTTTPPTGISVSGSAPTYTFTVASAPTEVTMTGGEWPTTGSHAVYRGSAGSPVDLSKEDVFGNANAGGLMTTANTYVIHSPGMYMIPLVYGNAITDGATNVNSYSTTGLSSAGNSYCVNLFYNAYDTGISSPYIETDLAANSHTLGNALLVWEEVENLISVNPTLETYDGIKYLVFEVPASTIAYSNAVIGVKDDAGNVVWSWHVWATASDLYEVDTEYGAGVTLLSENIGQKPRLQRVLLNPSLSCLARFKWTDGSVTKKAILTIDRTENSVLGQVEREANCTQYQWGRKDPFPYISTTYGDMPYEKSAKSSLRITPGTAIMNPNLFRSNDYPNDWCTEVASGRNLWNMQFSGVYNVATIKTIYDPSPVGYCVPRYSTWQGFSFNTNYLIDLNGDGYLNSNDYNIEYGWYFKRSASDTEGYFMLYQARIDPVSSAAFNAYWLSVGFGTEGNALYFTSANLSTSQSFGRSYGFCVRPQKIEIIP